MGSPAVLSFNNRSSTFGARGCFFQPVSDQRQIGELDSIRQLLRPAGLPRDRAESWDS
jgi:hypothetical protein